MEEVGSKLEYDQETRSHRLTIYLDRPRQEEVDALTSSPVCLSLFSAQGITWLLYSIENVCNWSDIPISQDPFVDVDSLDNKLTIFLSHQDGTVAAVRRVSLPEQFIEEIQNCYVGYTKKPLTHQKFEERVNKVWKRYPSSLDMYAESDSNYTINNDQTESTS